MSLIQFRSAHIRVGFDIIPEVLENVSQRHLEAGCQSVVAMSDAPLSTSAYKSHPPYFTITFTITCVSMMSWLTEPKLNTFLSVEQDSAKSASSPQAVTEARPRSNLE